MYILCRQLNFELNSIVLTSNQFLCGHSQVPGVTQLTLQEPVNAPEDDNDEAQSTTQANQSFLSVCT